MTHQCVFLKESCSVWLQLDGTALRICPKSVRPDALFSKIAVQAEGESFYFSEVSPAWLTFAVLQKQNLSVYLCAKITLTIRTVTADVEQFSTVSSNVSDTQSSLLWREGFGHFNLLLCECTRPPTAETEANFQYFSSGLKSVDINKPCQTQCSKSEGLPTVCPLFIEEKTKISQFSQFVMFEVCVRFWFSEGFCI